jgi:hypothetical protein
MKQKTTENIFKGIIDYIYDNTSFESKEVVTNTIKKIHTLNNMEGIFRCVIEDRLLNFNQSLEWLYFICSIINIINEESINIPTGFDLSFNLDTAIVYLSNIYTYKQEQLNEYFDYSESDDD